MTAAVAPTESGILTALRTFLLAVLPAGVEVVKGQPNRVAEVAVKNFVVMSPPRYNRLRTNVDGDADVKFTGSIAGTAMTVTAVAFGAIAAGATVFGVGVADDTEVVSQTSGAPGGAGVYEVSESQTIAAQTLSSGATSLEQGAEVTVQLDFHSDDGAAGDMAQVVSTVLRDQRGVAMFAAQDPNHGVVPLHADDPRQMPFHNEEQQVEWRWVLDACLQANQVVSLPQQYADSVEVEVLSVEAEFPA